MNHIKNLLFISILALNISCNKKPINIEKWEQFVINPKISENKVYKDLNKEKEIFSALEDRDSTVKKSSAVSYFLEDKFNPENSKYSKLNSKQNNCRGYFFNKNLDTLSIKIGFGNGFGGRGFIIKLNKNKFYTEAYHSDDVIIEGKIEPTHQIIYQKLTLNKASYKAGDSLFGHIEFKSIETDQHNNKIQYFGKGYFRTKIKKL